MYTITLEVNQICNLRCTYCYLGRKTNQKMSEQIAYKGLEIAFLNVERHRDRRLWVDFVGGEALLSAYCEAKRPDLRSKTVAFRF